MKRSILCRPNSFCLFALLVLSLSFAGLARVQAQVSQEERNSILEKAEGHFASQEYKQALFYYNRLLNWFPEDPGYRYTAGICLVELETEPARAIDYLTYAAVNRAPSDAYFYLGKAYMQREEYDQARESFERFRKLADKKQLSEFQVDNYILMCEHRGDPQQGMLTGHELERKEPEPLVAKASPEQTKQAEKETATPGQEHDALLGEAMTLQARADSLGRIIVEKKRQLAGTPSEEDRTSLKNEIEQLEMQQIRIQQQADAGFREAGKLEQTGSLLTETGTADIQAVQEPGPSISLQQGQAELAEQPEDEFYRESPYLKLFSRKDLDRLEWINGVQREGDTYMSRARNAERKAEEWKVRADGAQNASQQRKFLSKLKKEEEDALKRKMQAVDYYQVANENKYLLFNDIIEEGKASVNHPDRSERVGIFLDRARSQYSRAQEIRQEALKKGDLKERYQGLVEANAYEIVTLENQKFAFMSLAGVPLPENVAVTSQTKTAEIPGNVGTAQEVAGIARPVSTQNQTTEAKEPVKQQAGSETTPPPAEAVSTEPPSRTAEQKVPVQEAANIPEKTVSGSSAVPAENNMPAPWYRIQMGVFSTPKEEAYFRGLGPVTTEPVPGKEMTRYFVGGWPYYEEAGNTLARARREGFDQAFIVATLEGKRIALSKARSLENTAQQPATPEPSTIDWEVTQGARPVYKIQVGAFRGDPSDEMKETYRKLAAGEAVEKITNELGITLYTIGNFYTFEEAVRFRNRLAANGLKDCFVTAFLEGRKISVPEARKMTGK